MTENLFDEPLPVFNRNSSSNESPEVVSGDYKSSDDGSSHIQSVNNSVYAFFGDSPLTDPRC